jgi:hypothetical protein
MVVPFSRILATFAICGVLATTTEAARAQRVQPNSGSLQIVSTGQIVGVVVGIAAVGAAIGIGIYFAARHDRSLTGCTASGTSGIQLRSEGDHQTYALIGDVASIKTGDRVRVSGKKKKDAGNGRPFLVEKLSKDFGPCKNQAGMP